MKKIMYLMVLVLGLSGCSVDSYDSSEDLITADAKGNKQDVEEDPLSFYSGNSGNLKGTISITNDCDNLIVTITPAGDSPDEAFLGIYTELPALNPGNNLDGDLPYDLTDANELTWTVPFDIETPSYYIISKAWGDYVGTMEHGKLNYVVYNTISLECEKICPFGKGYWKNHSNENPGNQEDAWQGTGYEDGMAIGSKFYSREELNVLLDESNANGNGLIILSQQLIAAKLNMAIGAIMEGVEEAIEDADSLIGELEIGTDSFSDIEKEESKSIKNLLTQFNELCEDSE